MTAALIWIRSRFFGSAANTAVTLVMLALLGAAAVPVVRWAVTDGVFGPAAPAVCREAGGACWAFIHEKYRLILFGRYPYEEQWRPLLAMALLIGLILASCDRRLWGRGLLAAWAAGLGAYILLMRGGVLGLSHVGNDLWGGLPLTLLLSVAGIAAAFPLSIALALGRRSNQPILRALSIAFIEFVRGVPLVSVLFLASFVFPLFLPRGVSVDELLRALVAIILFTAAYLAEAIRGGLQAVPQGQVDAAKSLGLRPWQTTLWIVLPQALRLVIPPIVNTFIALFKDTSLVGIVGLMDLLLATKQALADPLWRSFSLEAYLVVAAIYFVFCFSMSRYSQFLERRLRRDRT